MSDLSPSQWLGVAVLFQTLVMWIVIRRQQRRLEELRTRLRENK